MQRVHMIRLSGENLLKGLLGFNQAPRLVVFKGNGKRFRGRSHNLNWLSAKSCFASPSRSTAPSCQTEC